MERVTADRAIDLLIAAGVEIEVQGASRIDLLVDGRPTPVEMKVRQTPATPSEIARDIRRAEGRPLLYVVPRLTSTLRRAAGERGLAVVAVEDGVVLIDGQELRPLAAATTPTLPRSSRRIPWGRFALLRVLCRTREPRTQADLAEEAGVTQAAVSQSLSKLNGLVERGPSGWSATNARQIAEKFLAEYPGAGGIGINWFALDPVNVQADKALHAGLDENAMLSGDVGADRIAPWRIPAKAIVYAGAGLDLASAGFAQATAERATLELRVPADPTLWRTANAFAGGKRPLTADPLIVAHDVLRTGGADADDAVEQVLNQLTREWRAR